MKTAIFVLVFVCLGVFTESASTKKCSVSPLTGQKPCDNLKPKHCYPPVCGETKDGQNMWFTNSCYLNYYNHRCHTNYKIISDSLCDAGTKPKTPEIGKEPCGHSTRKPETHHSTKHPTTKQNPIENIKPGGFGGHNEVDW